MAEVVNDPGDGGGRDVSRIIHVFSISKIRVSAVIVIDSLASLPSSPPSDEGGDQSIYLDCFVTE